MVIDKIAKDINGNQVTFLGQWDSDIYVYISDVMLTEAYQVQFCNSRNDSAFVMESTYSENTLRVKVPNKLLQEPYAVTGFIPMELDDGTRTMFRFRINIISKPMPSDYIGVDTDDYVSAQIMLEEMRAAVLEITEAKEEAEESIAAVKTEAEAVMEALRTTSVEFNFGTYDDGNGNVTIVATVVR